MRIFLTGLFFFTLFVLPARWYFVCKIRNNCGITTLSATTVDDSRASTLRLIEKDSVVLEGFDEFQFADKSVEPILNESNESFIRAMANLLHAHSDKNLTITGQFHQKETDISQSIYENIGLARAAHLETLLEDFGVSEKRITLDYESVDTDSLMQPLSFVLYAPDENEDRFQRLQYRFEDMTFTGRNFKTGESAFDPNISCLNYLDSLQTHLADNNETILIITGHTDNTGPDEANYKLGLNYADNVARFLLANYSITADIQTQSMGDKAPIAPNTLPDGSDNPTGRQKNRRVNFKLIEKDIEQ